jgi:hypothetical protein
MKYHELIKDYYGNLNNLSQLLKSMSESYRLLIGGAAELNNIPEAKNSYVKDAVRRADKLGETIDHLISLMDSCGESYYKYCTTVNEFILKNSSSDIILTEVDNELLFQNSTIRDEEEENIEERCNCGKKGKTKKKN